MFYKLLAVSASLAVGALCIVAPPTAITAAMMLLASSPLFAVFGSAAATIATGVVVTIAVASTAAFLLTAGWVFGKLFGNNEPVIAHTQPKTVPSVSANDDDVEADAVKRSAPTLTPAHTAKPATADSALATHSMFANEPKDEEIESKDEVAAPAPGM